MPADKVNASDSDLFIVAASSRLAGQRATRTVQRGLDVPEVMKRITDDRATRFVRDMAADGLLRIWSIRDSPVLRIFWERIRPGDWLLFYHRGYIRIAACASGTIDSPELAAGVWGEDSGDELRLLVAFGRAAHVEVPAWRLREELGGRFLGFRRLGDDRLRATRATFGSVDAFIKTAVLAHPAAEKGRGGA